MLVGMAYECKCGKDCSTKDAARGHVQFSSGEVSGVEHGSKQELPDNWRDMFTPRVEPESDDESDEQADADDGADAEGNESDETPDADSGDTDGSQEDGTAWYHKTPAELLRSALGGGEA